MKICELTPRPLERIAFSWAENRASYKGAGCYVLAAFDTTVMYVGLAKSIKTRMADHLDSQDKRKGANGVVPFWFYSIPCLVSEMNAIERGWINQSILIDGLIPPLNRVHSPV